MLMKARTRVAVEKEKAAQDVRFTLAKKKMKRKLEEYDKVDSSIELSLRINDAEREL